jgi:hypothetical protein
MRQSQFDPPAIVVIYNPDIHLNVIPQLISLLVVVFKVVSQPNFCFHSLLPPASCPILHTKWLHNQMSAGNSCLAQLSLYTQPTTVSATYATRINPGVPSCVIFYTPDFIFLTSKYFPDHNLSLEIRNLRSAVKVLDYVS